MTSDQESLPDGANGYAFDLTEAAFQRAKADPRFLHLLCLTRGSNMVRFLVLAAASHGQSDDSAAQRARMNGGLAAAAAAREMLYQIQQIRDARTTYPLFDALVSMYNDPFTEQVRVKFMNIVRSKLVAHVVKDNLSKGFARVTADTRTALFASSNRDIDRYYPMADMAAACVVSDNGAPSNAESAAFVQRHAPAVSIVTVDDDTTSIAARHMRWLAASQHVAFVLLNLVDHAQQELLIDLGVEVRRE